jgi:hypothetical protein
MHDPDRLGIGEVVNLSYTVAPSGVNVPDAVQWDDTAPWPENPTPTDPNPKKPPLTGPFPAFTAPFWKCSDLIILTLESGPSAGSAVQLKQDIILPTGMCQIPKDKPGTIYHDGVGAAAPAGAPLPSAGSLRWNCLLPVNVSWANVQTSETDCLPATATGTCAGAKNIYHEQGTTSELITPLWHGYAYVPKDNAWESDQVDIVFMLLRTVGQGEVVYNIAINVRTTGMIDCPVNGIFDMPQTMIEDSTGTVTLSKGGLTTVAPLTINGAYAPYVGPFPNMRTLQGPVPNKW